MCAVVTAIFDSNSSSWNGVSSPYFKDVRTRKSGDRKVPSGTLGHGKPGLGAAQRNVPELLALRPLLFLRLHGLCPAGGQGPEALSSWPLPVVRIVSQCLVGHFEEEGT